MTHEPLNRRKFLGIAATAATVTIVPRHVLGGGRTMAPSDKMNIAGIGVGGMGGGNAIVTAPLAPEGA